MSNKCKIIPKQMRSSEICSFYKTYRNFLKFNYLNMEIALRKKQDGYE